MRPSIKRVVEVFQHSDYLDIQIVDYEDEHHDVFRRLNHEWITTYFQLEEFDNKVLDHPREQILDPGGHIFMAIFQGELVGTCALIRTSDTTFELAKMAVSPKAQGKRIGWLLAQAAIKKAKELGAEKLYLESNTDLKQAISLYQKLGFKQIDGPRSPYSRANIQMELLLTSLGQATK